ncbi:hypothetical protein [Photorhabdus hindustanensis]|uniref:hypothetical protein n=1 Tax=Photorhabdus hindustanensis TaxID=2918802 RepID=UPI0020012C2B|nr:hypothetical protein [Photorhabdus hindustanensis]
MMFVIWLFWLALLSGYDVKGFITTFASSEKQWDTPSWRLTIAAVVIRTPTPGIFMIR